MMKLIEAARLRVTGLLAVSHGEAAAAVLSGEICRIYSTLIAPDCADNMVMVPRALVEEAAVECELLDGLSGRYDGVGYTANDCGERLRACLQPPSPTQSPGGEGI